MVGISSTSNLVTEYALCVHALYSIALAMLDQIYSWSNVGFHDLGEDCRRIGLCNLIITQLEIQGSSSIQF